MFCFVAKYFVFVTVPTNTKGALVDSIDQSHTACYNKSLHTVCKPLLNSAEIPSILVCFFLVENPFFYIVEYWADSN